MSTICCAVFGCVLVYLVFRIFAFLALVPYDDCRVLSSLAMFTYDINLFACGRMTIAWTESTGFL